VTARLVLPADAPRDEWLAKRREGITASEIAVILGISPFDSPFNLYYKKRGEIGEDFDNTAMSLGRHLEPWIADRWAADHPEWKVAPSGLYVSLARPWQMCTPDRDLYDAEWYDALTPEQLQAEDIDPQSLLEIKSSGTYEGWGEDGTDEIPAYYRAQVLWQLDTLGLAEAHVTCLFLSTRQRRDYVVAWDEADVLLMREAAREFLDRVERGDAPPIDHTPATTAALRELYPLGDDDTETEVPADLAAEYRAARAALDQARERYDLAVNRLRAAMGDARRALTPDGDPVASRSVYERTGVDTRRLRADYPDAYTACRTVSTVDQITPARAKKEHQ